jgi:hypothetical protein
MISYVTVGTNDLARAARFYDELMVFPFLLRMFTGQ